MEDVIKDMLNTASKDMKFKKVFIEDIVPSKFNQYPMQEIEELALNIAETGLLHPITLYQMDDDKYMILSGERRYRAMKLNYENGDDRWEEIPAIIKVDKLDDRLLKRYIRRGNANRESLSKELKIDMVRESLEDYYITKDLNQIPKGMLKRKWISMDTGFSERSVQDYLNCIESQNKDNLQKIKQKNVEYYEELQKSFSSRLKTPVKITNKKITINIKSEEDLQRIIEILDIQEE